MLYYTGKMNFVRKVFYHLSEQRSG